MTALHLVPYGNTYLQSLREAGAISWAHRGEVLSCENETAPHVLLLVSGYAMAIKRTRDGQQQNVALYVPGDLVGHESFTLGVSRCGTIALTAVTIYKVPLARLRNILDASAENSTAFWRYVAFHGALAHEWLLSIGRRSAYTRTAHFLCEIIHRTSPQGAGDTSSCPMPMTQTELADTLGLSVVHVNRTLMRLKQEGLINLRRGHIDVLDWPRFKAAAEFDSAYLALSN